MRMACVVVLLVAVFCPSTRADRPKLRATLIGHRGAVNALVFAPVGNTLASAGEDGTVRLWSLASGRNVATFVHPSPVLSVAFDKTGLRLIAGCRDGTVKVWSLLTGRNTATIHAELAAKGVQFDNTIWDSFFGENKAWVAYPADKKPVDGISLWDLNTSKEIPLLINCNSLNLDVSAGAEGGWAIANEEPHYPDQPVSVGEISFTPVLSRTARCSSRWRFAGTPGGFTAWISALGAGGC